MRSFMIVCCLMLLVSCAPATAPANNPSSNPSPTEQERVAICSKTWRGDNYERCYRWFGAELEKLQDQVDADMRHAPTGQPSEN